MQTSVSTSEPPAPDGFALAGAPNFRDLGGWRGADGRVVAHGLVFRSGDLSAATAADLQRLRSLAIRLIVDLRSEHERLHRPNRWHEDGAAELLALDLIGDLRAAHHGLRALLLADPTSAGARRMMLETYRRLPEAIGSVLQRLFVALAETPSAALIHCTAGKDRTGVICACLLHVLGVSRDDIYADYLLTAKYATQQAAVSTASLLESILGAAVSPSTLAVVHGVSAEFLDAAFAQMEQTHGSVDAYLRAAGIDTALQTRLRSRLLHGPAV